MRHSDDSIEDDQLVLLDCQKAVMRKEILKDNSIEDGGSFCQFE